MGRHFIEPKGKHLKEYDKWKQDFLKEITDKFEGKILEFKTKRKTQKYRLVGVPFYNNEDENKFKQSLYEVVEN
jgi:type III restriction enzyme